jgi:hypothetical protein
MDIMKFYICKVNLQSLSLQVFFLWKVNDFTHSVFLLV